MTLTIILYTLFVLSCPMVSDGLYRTVSPFMLCWSECSPSLPTLISMASLCISWQSRSISSAISLCSRSACSLSCILWFVSICWFTCKTNPRKITSSLNTLQKSFVWKRMLKLFYSSEASCLNRSCRSFFTE